MKLNTKIIVAAASTFLGIYFLSDSDNDNYYEDSYTGNYGSEYQESEANFDSQEADFQPQHRSESRTKRSPGRNDKVEMKKIINPQTGKVVAHIPLPASWKIESNMIKGPDGLIAREYQFKMFDNMQRRPMSAEQILKQEIEPSIRQAGGTIKNTFPIKAISDYDAAYSSKLYGSASMRKHFEALGVDLIDNKGNANLLIIRLHVYAHEYGGNWGYMTHTLECRQKVYDWAKNAYIFGIANVQSDPQQIAEYNRNEAAKANNSWAAHNTRMRNNQAAFESRNQQWRETSNAISDMGMATWRNNNASQDRMQDMTVNGINGTENIYDPSANQTYNVESGYDRYFMNGQGEYFGTNDQFYEPGQDLNITGEWTESQRRGN